MNDLPDPLVSADCDLRDLQWMPLDVSRLRDSELAAVADAEVFRVAVLSWCVSWHQSPASSLPDDDAVLARLLGFGRDIKGWKKARLSGGLRGWVKCSDGRLYHPVVAGKAKEAADQKDAAKRKRKHDADRLSKWRANRDSPHEETHHETRFTGVSDTTDDTRSETRCVAERPDQTLPDQTLPEITTPPPSPGISPRESGPAGPEATAASGGGAKSRITNLRPAAIRRAIEAGDALAVITGFGGSRGRGHELDEEWLRDATGLQVGELAAVLWWEVHDRDPVRLPSGLRAAKERWQAQGIEARRQQARLAMDRLGVAVPQEAGAA